MNDEWTEKKLDRLTGLNERERQLVRYQFNMFSPLEFPPSSRAHSAKTESDASISLTINEVLKN